MSRVEKQLNRKPDNAPIAGVCAGLGDYFDVDPLLVRAGFIATTMFGGFGPVLYVVLWVLMEQRDESAPPPPPVDGLADGFAQPTQTVPTVQHNVVPEPAGAHDDR